MYKIPKEVFEVNIIQLTAGQNDTLGIHLQKPKFPQYAVVSKRADSYKSWPEYLPLKPEVLIEAGLVYTGDYFIFKKLKNFIYIYFLKIKMLFMHITITQFHH